MSRIIKYEYYDKDSGLEKFLFRMRNVLVWPIALYQKFLSSNMPPVCRFTPSCSEYARHAILRYGFFRGVFYGAVRIVRCNPFFRGGYDPLL